MNITENKTNHETEYGTVIHHECTNHDGVANTQYQPYSFDYWTATKNGKTSSKYYAKGYAINWLKRQK